MATKTLIIVESPAKTRTIKHYLGDDYEVMASMGHVRDLPEHDLGVDPKKHFAPKYVAIKDKSEIISKLRKAVERAERVYLAMDPDREGEAIAWHLHEVLGLDGAERIEFNEITQTAVKYALAHPRKIDMPRVDAQQARRVLDRLVGYQLSPLLWKKVRSGLSAGRVQSVAVKLVCDREKEIQAFVAEEYWTIIADLLVEGDETRKFSAKLIEQGGKKLKLSNEEEARTAERYLQQAAYRVAAVKRSQQQRSPQPPFITSTLQQEANRSHGFSAKRTMALAQQLYEGIETSAEGQVGLITYMRTDSTRVSNEAQASAAEYIETRYGKEYLPGKERKAKAVKGAQEAHEAIRPTDVTRTPEQVAKDLNPDQLKLYRLIWKRFLASQMANAVLDVVVVDVAAGDYLLRANGQRVKFPGFRVLSPESEEAEFLPAMNDGDPLELQQLNTAQNFTQPPARYTEATLVKALESRGIGRPSTYAPILSTIVDRRYAFLEAKKFHPTGLGMVVTEQLEKHFPNIIDPDFTAHVEGELDAIESGAEDWVQVLEKFYGPFEHALEEAAEKMERIKVPDVPLEQTCPECSKGLVLREGRFGRFVACSGFPECKYTTQEEQLLKAESGEEGAEGEALPQEVCEECGAPMVVRRSRRGPFLGCSRYPECKTIKQMPGEPEKPKKEPAQWTSVKCEKCGSPMALRTSKRGQFLGCSGFPKCRSIQKLPEEGTYEIIPREEKPKEEKPKAAAKPKTETKAKPKASGNGKAATKAKTTKAKTTKTAE
ncbi:MAG: type I DNA topoisomerase [Armatimonadota bacterium]